MTTTRTNFTNDGRAWEQMLLTTMTHYQSRGRLSMRKVTPPVRYFGKRIIHLENPFLDFVGVWTECGGRAVFLEAKSTKEPRLAIGTGGLTTRQLETLFHWEHYGAAVGVLWEHGGQCKFMSPASIRQARADGFGKSLRWQHHGYPVKQGEGTCLVDFLPALHTYFPF